MNENNLTDAATIIPMILIAGAILKHAFPTLPNRFIPLMTWILGALGYLLKSGDWTGPNIFTAILVAASATGIHSGLKNTMEKSSNGAASGGSGFPAWVLLAALPAFAAGCANTGKAIATSAVTVDSAMTAWAEYVATGKASAKDELAVASALETYQAALKTAQAAYRASYPDGNTPAYQRASAALTASRFHLLNLIETIIRNHSAP